MSIQICIIPQKAVLLHTKSHGEKECAGEDIHITPNTIAFAIYSVLSRNVGNFKKTKWNRISCKASAFADVLLILPFLAIPTATRQEDEKTSAFFCAVG